MNIHDLKIFEAVASQGSFTKAASKMNTVQSNVTARIKSLEDEFATQLFSRTSKKVELTSAGEKLMIYSKQISYLIDEAKREMSTTSGVFGSLKIGCIETTLALKVPDILKYFMNTYPDVNLEFKSGMSSSLVSDVLSYKLDAAFVGAPVDSSLLTYRVVKEEKLVIISSSQEKSLNAFIKGGPLKIVVFDQGCSYRSRLESWLSSKGIVNYQCIVLNTIEGIINFVEAGIGITILPIELIKQIYGKRKLQTYPVGKELGTLTTLLIYSNNTPPSKALKAFIEMY